MHQEESTSLNGPSGAFVQVDRRWAWAVSIAPVALACALAVAFGDPFGTWMLGGGGTRGLLRMALVGLAFAVATFVAPRPVGILVGVVIGLALGLALFASVVSPTPPACRDGRELCENVGGLVTALYLGFVAGIGVLVGGLAEWLWQTLRPKPSGPSGPPSQ